MGYSCYDVVLLTAKEAEQMPAEAQLALRRFLECGGTLLVHGRKVPAPFSQNATADDHGGYFVGLGYAVASGAESEKDWEKAARTLDALPLYQYLPYQKPADSHNLLVAEAKVPVGGMFALVLLFAVGIGPVNVWLLSRYKRRIWLWWNVPAISLLTCLAVFGYSVFSEGWSGHGKIASMTLLDQRTHRATTFGYASYFCPLTPSSGPRFSAETEVALLGDEQDRYRPTRERPRGAVCGLEQRSTPAFRLDPGPRAGLLPVPQERGPPRAPDFCRQWRRACRGQRPGGRHRAALLGRRVGAGVRRPRHRGGRGEAAEAASLGGGRVAPGSCQFLDRHGLIFDPNWLAMLDRWNTDKDPAHLLIPGSYIAFLKKSPFVEARLDAARSQDTVAIVYGICEEQDHGR